MVDAKEVAKHNTKDDCWVILHGKAYDLTEFLPKHPGGQAIILKYAGQDATKAFDPIHPPDIVNKMLSKDKHLGEVENMEESDHQAEDEDLSEEDKQRMELAERKPALSQMFNMFDFEYVARKTMGLSGWKYYSSASDDEITVRENHLAYHRIWFRPRVMVDVTTVDFSTTMLGSKTSAPFYITATALGRLGHEDGEQVLTVSAGKEDIIYMIPTLSSCSMDEILDRAIDKQTLWMQIYVNAEREMTAEMVRAAEERGVKAFWITVDAPQLGRREKDMRAKYVDDVANLQDEEDAGVDRSQGAARAISSFIDVSLSWKDIKWFRSITKKPLVLKGVQRYEDVLLAIEHGVDGVVLSNHGGRQLEYSRPSIEVLEETMAVLREKGLENEIEIYLDGGVRRGTDILKAICLGAKGVGIGRPFLYAMSTYGYDGVRRAINLLKDELEMNMRLLGVNQLHELDRSFVDVRSLNSHAGHPSDSLMSKVYEPIEMPQFKPKL